jgi:transcriptional regulator with XRE-family HTH domain
MPKSLFTPAYASLIGVLARARRRAGIGQVELAERLKKSQSFVSRVETGERRVDVIEFCAIAHALGADPRVLFAELVALLPEDLRV